MSSSELHDRYLGVRLVFTKYSLLLEVSTAKIRLCENIRTMRSFIFIACLLTGSSVATTSIQKLEPHYGSMNGETTITISGSEFADDSFNALGAFADLGNSVYFFSDTKEYECPVNKDATDEDTITCSSQPMEEGTYYIRLKVNGHDIPDSAYCGGSQTSYACSFTVVWWRTPLIWDIRPESGAPNEIVVITGRIFTDKLRSSDSTSNNGVTASIRRVWLSGMECELFDSLGESYGATLAYNNETEAYGNTGSFICHLNSNYVYSMNGSFIIDEDYGRSRQLAQTFKVSNDYKLYMYQSHAGIESISPNTGSIHGGTEISIKGNYFDDADVIVIVGGSDCEITVKTDTLLKCTTQGNSDVASKDKHPGSRGVVVEVYEGLEDVSAIDGISYEEYTGAKSKMIGDNSAINYEASVSPVVIRVSGFFLAAVDGQYLFSSSKQAYSQIFLSTDGSPDNKVLNPGTVSLAKGVLYYYEFVHTESSNQVEVTMKAYLRETSYNYNQTSMARPERQNITSSSPDEHEIQTVALNDWNAESNSIKEQFILCITCVTETCSASDQYYFSLHGLETERLLASGDPAAIKKWIEYLPTMHGDTVTVTRNTGPDSCSSEYTIEVDNPRGHLPLQVHAAVDAGQMTADLSVLVMPKASRTSFTLAVNGIPSSHATVGDESSVADAVKSLFSPNCPTKLTQPGISWISVDFELGVFSSDFNESSGEIVSEDSYCGFRSLKNPTSLKIRPFINNAIDDKSKFCMAFKGTRSIGVSVFYFYTSTTGLQLDGELEYHYVGTSSWQHICQNLFTDLTGLDGSMPRFSNITITVDDSEGDLFIDDIFVGFSEIDDLEVAELRKMRNLPETTIKLKDVSVEVAGSVYTITMKVHECRTDLPLLEAAYGTMSDGGVAYTDTSWGSASISVARVQAAAPEIGGTFSITLPGTDTINGIQWNVEASQLEAYLESIPGLTDVTVARDGSCRGYTWGVVFEDPAGYHETLSAAASFTNNDASIVTDVVTNGGLYLDPIRGDWLRPAYSTPQVAVVVNNVPSICQADACPFQYVADSTPTITSVDVDWSTLTMTISGSKFSPTEEDNVVIIAGTECTVTSAGETAIECTMHNSPSGNQKVHVFVAELGYSNEYAFDIPITVVSIEPVSGSTAGGTYLTITGFGFSQDTPVSLGAVATCKVESVIYDALFCVTGSNSEAGEVDVMVGDDSVTVTGLKFTFEDPPASGSVSTATMSVAGGFLTIDGNGFGAADEDNKAVYIDTEKANIDSWTDTSITVIAPSMPPGTYTVNVDMQPAGYADLSAGNLVEYILEVTALSLTSSSLMGGLELEFTGTGFGEDMDVEVSLGELPCLVDFQSDTSVTCRTGSSSWTHPVNNQGAGGYAWEPATLTIKVGDKVKWSWSQISGVVGAMYQVFSMSSADSTTYDGNGFNSGPQTAAGSLEYRFNEAGTFYYGGFADTAGNIFMPGVIIVNDAPTVSYPVSLKVNGQEAIYPNGVMAMQYSMDVTPSITSISPNSGTAKQIITITGTGFSDINDDNVVTIGDSICEVSAASATELTCRIAEAEQPDIGSYQEVKVHVAGKGYSLSTMRTKEGRYFVVVPYISTYTPTTGSLLGGTQITISGGGLTNVVSVKIGGLPCIVTSSQYGSVSCTTSAAPEGNHDIEVVVFNTVYGIETLAVCESECSFSHSASATVSATSITPPSIEGQTQVVIEWNGEATDTVVVMIGTIPCTNPEVTNTDIKCTVDGLAHGTYDVSIDVAGKGFADGSLKLTSLPVMSSIEPTSGSVNGFTTVKIHGNGFPVDLTDVSIGSNPCQVFSVTTNLVECITTPSEVGSFLVTITSFESSVEYSYNTESTPTVTGLSSAEGSPGEEIVITVNVGAYSEQPIVELGEVPCAVSESSENTITCTVSSRYGGDADISVVFPDLGKADVADGIVFRYAFHVTESSPLSGSLGGGQDLIITGFGFSQESTVTICDITATVTAQSSTSLTVTTPAADFLISGDTCEVIVMNPGESETSPNTFTYDESVTPEITGVSPTTGGTGGGTVITITGSKLDLVTQVTIDGVECGSIETTETTITCTTDSHSGSIKTLIRCSTATGGLASGLVEFFYVDKWSSVYTWGGSDAGLPQDGEFVTITKDQTILLDTTTNKLKMLLIDGGEVIFENEGFVHLQAEHILIVNGGLLEIGTEDKPYTAQAEITMYGHIHSAELPIYGAKTLGVRKGRLEMHGKPIDNTWALLDVTASAGATQIVLNIPVLWSVGDQIVIASTGHRHSQIENEKRQIADIVTDEVTTTITLSEPLEYEHLGVTETYTDADGNTHEFDYRAEVGLLSRNIVFRGSEDSSWTEDIPRCPDDFDTGMFKTQTCFQGRFGEESGSDQFGASIMLHSKGPSTDANTADVQAHIEYVELTYPIHWHLMGDMTGNYVRGCSIHRTFNRAVTIHNTHNLLVERNVIYNVMGGAFFIEDGIETGNIIQYNLAVFVKQSTSLLNDDITPAAYWVTNPNNTIQHNHAAGGTHFGFWYRMHEHPDGPSFTPDICQQYFELGIFRNNSAHSQGWFGLWIFQVYLPREGSGCDSTRPMAAKFYTLTSWHCEKGAEWVEGGAIQFIGFKLASNEDSAIDIKLIFGTEWSKEDRGAMIKDSLIIGRANFEEASAEGKYGIVLPFAPGLWIDGVVFVNFVESDHTAFFVTHISGTCTHLCGGWHYRMENLAFINTNTRIIWRWEHEGIIEDLDGSFTGATTPRKVVPHSDIFIDGTQCQEMTHTAFSPPGAYPSMNCSSNVRFHRLAFNNVQPTSLQFKNATFVRMDDDQRTTKSIYAKKRLTHADGWMVVLPGGYSYLWGFEEAGDFVNMTYSAKVYDLFEDDYIILKHVMSQVPSRVALCGDTNEDCEFFAPANMTEEITSSSHNRQWHYDDVFSLFTYIVTRKMSSRKRRGSMNWQQMDGAEVSNYVIEAKIERCIYENCEVPIGGTSLPDVFESDDDAHIVTSFDDTGDCFVVTADGDEIDVTIPGGCWVIWAIPNGTVRKLTVDVNGNLEFIDDRDITLTATYIVVSGRFIAGFSVTMTRRHLLDIILTGEPTATELVANNGVVIGSKVLACHGTCDLHGQDVVVSWTKLSETAPAGSTQIVLREAVPWAVNDEIVIAPTGFNAWGTETRRIVAISADGRTITLDALDHDHKSEIRSYGSGRTIDFSAEVGLLTRTITISGEESADSFGPRVLVTTTELDYTAKGRFSNVEFIRTGQEGYYDDYDPRHSIAFKNAGTGSEVRKCAFHDGYATAIGTYGTDGTKIWDNVIHHTVNEGVVIKGFQHRLERNLVVLNIFRGSYLNRMETTNYDYTGAINVEAAIHLKMTGNVVAGAERIAYRISGQPCDTDDQELWLGNVAHATLLGTAQMKTSLGGELCSLVHGFTLYNVWDFAIYHQTIDSVIVKNCNVADATVGYMPLIAGPDPLSHIYEEKTATVTNCLFVARRDENDCDVDISEDTDHSLIIRRLAGVNKKAPSTPTGGRTGVMLALFEGAYNEATFKALHVNMNYPALYGQLRIEDVTFANFKKSCSATDAIFYTNPLNEDVFHPTHLSGIVLENCETDSLVFLGRPNINNINPSDCVDMQCDAKLKVLINDEDGSFLGTPGSIISESEHGWGSQALGLGDYRIPSALLAGEDGTQLSADSVVPNKGIARNGQSCELKDEWQAYRCTGDTYQYRMMIIESMDDDTETRRLSPLAVKVDGTIDLVNGPQDHGWCSGYTCQKRISTFYTIVPEGKTIDIYFSSTPPQQMKFHLINAPETEKVTVAIWIPTPQKLNVFVNGSLIDPSNLNGNRLEKAPVSNPDLYKPDPTSCTAGQNYLDMKTRKLYVCLVGRSPIDIHTEPAVIISMTFPAISIDDFFDTNLENNLVMLLGIDPSKVRRVQVVSEQSTSRRRRRSTDTDVEVSVEITAASQEDALTLRNRAVEVFQSGEITVGGVAPTTMAVGGTQTADDITRMDAILRNGGSVEAQNSVGVPVRINVTAVPTGEELSTLSVALVAILDQSDAIVEVTAGSYEVTIELDKSGSGADANAIMSGTTTASFSAGVANFPDLAISHSGTYNLTFSTPSHNISSQTVSVVVQERSICADITGLLDSGLATEEAGLQFQLQLTDCVSGGHLERLEHKGYTYQIEVSFDEASLYGTAAVDGTKTFTFDSNGALTTTDLSLSSTTDYNFYNLNFRLYTSQASSYDKSVGVRQVQIYPSDPAQYIHNISDHQTIKLTFGDSYNNLIGNPYTLEAVETGLYNDMVRQYPDLYFNQFTVTANADGNLQIDTTVRALTDDSITDFYKNFDATGSISVGSRTIAASGSCAIQISGDCYQSANTVASSNDMTTIIIFAVLGTCVVLSIAIIGGTYLVKRHSFSKISAIRCTDASPNSLRPLHDVENDISWSRTSSPGYMEHSMTPVERN